MIDIAGWLNALIPDRFYFMIIVWVNYALAIACIIHEILRSRTSQGSIAWIISLVLLPLPTTFLYLVFGIKSFDDYAKLQTTSSRVLRMARAEKNNLLDQVSSDAWPVQANISQLPFLGGNDVELLIDGKATFESMFAGMRAATSTIVAQFYIIRDDELGREFAEVLIERAKAGVTVYLLYDDAGCFWLPRAYKQRLRDAGVNVASFNQRHRYLRIYGPTRINYRNHRKIVLVDGKEAWVGGLNVANEYLGKVKRYGKWRDTCVRVRGPAALALGIPFREDWHWATGEQIAPDIPKPIERPGENAVLVMPTGPADALEDCSIAFTDAISAARERLWIVSPYFVPDLDLQTALYAAALRGVDVRIMLPERPDHQMVWLASNAHASTMIDHGVAIYRYKTGFLHQKVILVDDKLAGVGTVNFDNRSMRINFELTLWFTHQKTIDAVTEMLEADFAKCRKFTLKQREKQSFYLRFMGQAARLMSPIL